MQSIKINQLKLENFKGIKEFELNAEGKNVSVYGDNGLGKTTIFDAFMWLLFDKDSQGVSNFNIKTLDSQGNPVSKLQHKVSARLDVGGTEIELVKVYTEKWTRKRGEVEETLTGHTVNHFINEVPKKKKEYDEYLNNIIDEDTFKTLTNPLHFNSIHWKDRRKLMLDLVDDIEDKEIIDSDDTLKELSNHLKDMSVNELKEQTISRRKQYKEDLKDIPGRIKELTEGLVEERNIKVLVEQQKALEGQLKELNKKSVDVLQTRIRSIEGSIKILENELQDIEDNSIRDLKNKQDTISDKAREVAEMVNRRKALIVDRDLAIMGLKHDIEHLKNMKDITLVKWEDATKLEFNHTDKYCNVCKQELPAENIDKLVNDFKESKDKLIKEVVLKGKELANKIESQEQLLSQENILLEELKSQFKELSKQQDQLEKEYNDVTNEIAVIDVTNTKEYKCIEDKIKALQGDIEATEKEIEAEDIEVKQSSIEVDLNEIHYNIIQQENRVKDLDRIKVLAKQERELNQAIADTELVESLIDRFVVAKAVKLESLLNSKFDIVEFTLFEDIISGGVKETFVTTVNGVPFEDLNNATKIKAGLDIINTLSEKYKVQAPIFLDNRESVNEIQNIDSQLINLVVSKDKTLKVEVE